MPYDFGAKKQGSAPAAAQAVAKAAKKKPHTHRMPDGSLMPGASHNGAKGSK